MNGEITAAALREAFRGTDGLQPLVLPDAEVVGSLEADMDTLRDALRRASWTRVEERRDDDGGEKFSVWSTDGVQVNFFFDWGAPIEFDFDLREIVDVEAVDGLVRLLRLVSSAVGKDVVVRAEGHRGGSPACASTQERAASCSPRSPERRQRPVGEYSRLSRGWDLGVPPRRRGLVSP